MRVACCPMTQNSVWMLGSVTPAQPPKFMQDDNQSSSFFSTSGASFGESCASPVFSSATASGSFAAAMPVCFSIYACRHAHDQVV